MPSEQRALANLLVCLKNGGFGDMERVLKLIHGCEGEMQRIESRRSTQPDSPGHYELLLAVDIAPKQLLRFMKTLRQTNVAEVSVLREAKSLTVQGTIVIYHYTNVMLINIYNAINSTVSVINKL